MCEICGSLGNKKIPEILPEILPDSGLLFSQDYLYLCLIQTLSIFAVK